ncbi:MAG: threonine synthase [Candidatus Izemoplasmatales bacterium]|nr:threonine synthase [Candidatus Izemoplasmatales bacterium]
MKYVKYLRCTSCNQTFPATPCQLLCPACKTGTLDVLYDYDSLKKKVTKEYFAKESTQSIWRYLPLLPVRDVDTIETLAVGMTPLYQANQLKKIVKMDNLYVKDDGLNPTLSLKDRASVVAICKAREAQNKVICCASTGNAASSLAGNAAKAGLKSIIFVPKRAPVGKLVQLALFGALVIKVDGDYKDAFDLSSQVIDRYGFYNRNAAINPYLVEGKKTVAYEISEQLGFEPIDWVVVSVGDGCTIAGVYKGFYDLYKLGLIPAIPRLLGVQADGCKPLMDAAITGQLVIAKENTIADSIAVGEPRNHHKALLAVKESQGEWISASDSEILSAMRLLGSAEGVFSEPAAACSVAGLIKARNQGIINRSDKTVVISTGNGLKDQQTAAKAADEPVLLENSIQAFINYYEKINKERK